MNTITPAYTKNLTDPRVENAPTGERSHKVRHRQTEHSHGTTDRPRKSDRSSALEESQQGDHGSQHRHEGDETVKRRMGENELRRPDDALEEVHEISVYGSLNSSTRFFDSLSGPRSPVSTGCERRTTPPTPTSAIRRPPAEAAMNTIGTELTRRTGIWGPAARALCRPRAGSCPRTSPACRRRCVQHEPAQHKDEPSAWYIRSGAALPPREVKGPETVEIPGIMSGGGGSV